MTISCCSSLSYRLTSWTVDPQCADDFFGPNYTSSSGDYVYCDNYYTFSTTEQAHLYLGMLEAVTAFSALMLVCHFALFVMACVETDRRRKWGKTHNMRVVYMVATAPDGGAAVDGPTYYTQVPPPQPGQLQGGNAGPSRALYA